MTLVRQNEHEVVLQCDGCDAWSKIQVFYAEGAADLPEARLMADAHGWKYGLDDAHVVSDYCPRCIPKDL